jgi:hypothetical protein
LRKRIGLVLILASQLSLASVLLAESSVAVHFVAVDDSTIILNQASLWTDGEEERRNLGNLPLPSEKTLAFDTLPSRLTLEAPGIWAPPIALEEGQLEARIAVWLTGIVHGTLPEKKSAELRLSIRFSASGDLNAKAVRMPVGSRPCRIDQASFSCEVPAGTADLKLEAEGYIPVYLWDVAVPRGGSVALKELALERGASISGWVEPSTRPLEVADSDRPAIDVRLSRAIGTWTVDPKVDPRFKLLERSTKATTRGFFQLRGIEAGSYDLVATRGSASGKLEGLVVESDSELALNGSLALQDPARLEALLASANQGWILVLFQDAKRSNVTREVTRVDFDAQGTARLGDLIPGRYRFEIHDRSESVWQSGEILLEPGANAPLVLDIAAVPVRGRAFYGQEPLAEATISFGELDRIRIRVPTSKDGDFAALLPRAGEWPLMIESPVIGWARNIPPVTVREGKELEIRLPATRLRGKVMFEGRPARDAFVGIKRRDQDQRTIANVQVVKDGTFEAKGFAAGEVAVFAYGPQGDSDWRFLEVTESKEEDLETNEIQEVELELKSPARLQGTVRSGAGLLPGAQISVVQHEPPFVAWRSDGLAGVDGRFSIKLPSNVDRVDLLVGAAGFGTELAGTVEVGSTAPIELGLAIQRGSIVLEGVDPLAEGLSMAKGTAAIAVWDLLRVLEDAGQVEWLGFDRVRLNDLAPGHYFLCAGGRTTCTRGQLADGSSLILAAPGSPRPVPALSPKGLP